MPRDVGGRIPEAQKKWELAIETQFTRLILPRQPLLQPSSGQGTGSDFGVVAQKKYN
jgi:hypothetical protein